MTEWDDLPTTGAPRCTPPLGAPAGAAIFLAASIIATFAAAWAATVYLFDRIVNQQETKP